MSKVGYVRVSTKEQNTARQEVIMQELGVDKLYIEKISGKNKERPELKKLMDYVRDGDTVVVESYSRFARSTMDLLTLINELEAKNVKFVSEKEKIDTSTPEGHLMMVMFAGLAEFERKSILERQKEGIQIAKEQGRFTGRPFKEIDDFEETYNKVKSKQLKVSEVCKMNNISRSTWYGHVKKYEDSIPIDFGVNIAEAVAENGDTMAVVGVV